MSQALLRHDIREPGEAPPPGGAERGRAFFLKWLRRLGAEYGRLFERERKPGLEKSEGIRPPHSLAVARYLNLLNLPLFWTGILLLFWLVLDSFLRLAGAGFYGVFAAIGDPVVRLAGPAAVGYWTNRIALRMLFRPSRRNKVWWGLIPARRRELIDMIAAGVSENLFSGPIVRDYIRRSGLVGLLAGRLASAARGILADERFHQELGEEIRAALARLAGSEDIQSAVRALVGRLVESWTAGSLKEKPLEWSKSIWGPWLQEKAVESLALLPLEAGDILKRLERALGGLPERLQAGAGLLEEAAVELVEQGLHALDVRGIVRAQLDGMDEQQLERLLTGGIDTEIVFIQTSGGIFGLAVALALMFPLARLILAGCALILVIIYLRTVERTEKS